MEGFQLHKKNSPPRKTRAPVWSHRAIVLAKVARSSRTAAAAASKQARKQRTLYRLFSCSGCPNKPA